MEIKDDQLKEFLEWYKSHYTKDATFEASLQLSMAGEFHLTAKQARPLIARCLSLGYIKKAGDKFLRIQI